MIRSQSVMTVLFAAFLLCIGQVCAQQSLRVWLFQDEQCREEMPNRPNPRQLYSSPSVPIDAQCSSPARSPCCMTWSVADSWGRYAFAIMYQDDPTMACSGSYYSVVRFIGPTVDSPNCGDPARITLTNAGRTGGCTKVNMNGINPFYIIVVPFSCNPALPNECLSCVLSNNIPRTNFISTSKGPIGDLITGNTGRCETSSDVSPYCSGSQKYAFSVPSACTLAAGGGYSRPRSSTSCYTDCSECVNDFNVWYSNVDSNPGSSGICGTHSVSDQGSYKYQYSRPDANVFEGCKAGTKTVTVVSDARDVGVNAFLYIVSFAVLLHTFV
jgi:hypothetical protein